MNLKRLTGFAILLFAIVGIAKAGSDIFRDISGNSGTVSVIAADTSDSLKSGEYLVFFFDGNSPCPVCERILKMTSNLMDSNIGPLVHFSIREVNVELPGNEGYILDLGLYSTSVVLALEADGKIIRWKNLEGVWDLAGDEKGFREYMLHEVEAFFQEEK
ncbi:MAG: hypothetical protein Q7I97_07545 [Thermovirgaceae bacterium]|nr:hypothetical protein [Thermovirgaceae bacterium]